jgi:hypothetical protein
LARSDAPLRDRAESDHLWAAGQPEKVVASLAARELSIPRDNLARWEEWHDRIARVLGPDHPDILGTRNAIARWTGQAGDARQALHLFTELLPDHQRVLGPDHRGTLRTRHNIAHWTGQAGNPSEALHLFTELLPDHPDTLRTRHNIAHWTGQAGDARQALRLFTQLLPDQMRVLGPDHPDTLETQWWITVLSELLRSGGP